MNVSTFLILLGWTSFIAAIELKETFRGFNMSWKSFKDRHNKTYGNAGMENERKGHFSRSRNAVKSCNSKGGKYSCRLNRFSDWTPAELKGRNKRLSPSKKGQPMNPIEPSEADPEMSRLSNITLPDAVDWTNHSCMTSIKDQGMCGSCWAFAACTPLEFRQCRAKNNTQVDLSAQNLVDCAGPQYGNYGCDGGVEYYGWDYIKANGGQDTSAFYPYTAVQGQCMYSPANASAKVRSRKLLSTDYDIRYQLAVYGPVAAAVYASFDEFYFYEQGIFTSADCSNATDHSVVLVGYGTAIADNQTNQTIDYWILRNSWGSDWGMNGYMWIQRGVNLCGIESDVSYPLV